MVSQSEFYVGYLPVPQRLRKAIRAIVGGLMLLAVAVSAVLIAGLMPFPDSSFEYQQYREFQGTLLTEPIPALLIPGQGSPWLLVGPGKHGAGDLRSFDGLRVTLTGERISHGEDHMIELRPGSLRANSTGVRPESATLGDVQLTGEIVDSKCYFGVMNPGNGKVHRDCAARCISGGIPPALLVRDASGAARTVLLAKWNRSLLDHVAEPVTLRGRLVQSAGRLTLYAE
jgi:hypothetical protein